MIEKHPKLILTEVYHNGLELIESPMLVNADLILMDIEMPVMNGLDAAAQMNKLYPRIPLIALTMHQENIYLEEIILAGFRGCIFKPNIPRTLFSVIEQVFNNGYIFPKELKLK